MALTLEDVQHVATLARLDLEPEEVKTLAGHLNKIIDNFTALQELDTSGVEPTDRVLPMTNVYRDDVVVPGISREDLLAGGPSTNHEAFIVPRVVETADGMDA